MANDSLHAIGQRGVASRLSDVVKNRQGYSFTK